MLSQLLIYIPSVMCAFWAVIYLLIAPRTRTYRMFLFYLAIATVYFFTDACYDSAMTSVSTLAITSLLAQLVAPMMIPIAIMYVAELNTDSKRISNRWTSWIILPITLFAIELTLIFLTGPGKIVDFISKAYVTFPVEGYESSGYKMLYICMTAVYRVLLAIGAIAYFCYIIAAAVKYKYNFKVFKDFLLRKGEITPRHLQIFHLSMLFILCGTKIVILREFFLSHQWVAALLNLLTALCICQACLAGLFAGNGHVSRTSTMNALRINTGNTSIPEEEDTESEDRQ